MSGPLRIVITQPRQGLTLLLGAGGGELPEPGAQGWPAEFPLPLQQLEALKPHAQPDSYPLPDEQVEMLTPPELPDSFPLPALQVAALTPPPLPASYPLPAVQVEALTPPPLPDSYPLPPAQHAALASEATANQIKARTDLLATDLTLLNLIAQQALILTRLGDIFGAVDGLEVTAGNIEISSNTLNLNTDQVEQHLREVRDRLPANLGQSTNAASLPVALSIVQEALLAAIRDRLPTALSGGRLAVDAGLSIPQPQTNALTNDELREAPVPTRDDFDGDAITPDQAGANAVLEFVVPALRLVAVDVDPVDPEDGFPYICRAAVDGSAPAANRGWRCRSGQTTYLPVPCVGGTVKVFAPTGVSVSVQGGVRV